MAFQPPNSGQERQNRKILEQLEEQKKRLRMQSQSGGTNVQSPLGAASPITPMPGTQPVSHVAGCQGMSPMLMPDIQAMTPNQRQALQHANANSVGYFITQDSSFGNLILPVLPRFEKITQ